MLVGNKCDETEARELTTREGEEHAKKMSCHFMETSAKTNHNVKELFQVSWQIAPDLVLSHIVDSHLANIRMKLKLKRQIKRQHQN